MTRERDDEPGAERFLEAATREVDGGAGLRARHEAYLYRRRLPHWRVPSAAYFVTWRVRTGGLAHDERGVVASALKHFDGRRYQLFAWVVMDDHVHVVFAPCAPFDVATIVHSWKSFTANRLQRAYGWSGAVWQDEYYDRYMRDEGELLEKMTYTWNNPWKRWPGLLDYPWVGGMSDAGAR